MLKAQRKKKRWRLGGIKGSLQILEWQETAARWHSRAFIETTPSMIAIPAPGCMVSLLTATHTMEAVFLGIWHLPSELGGPQFNPHTLSSLLLWGRLGLRP